MDDRPAIAAGLPARLIVQQKPAANSFGLRRMALIAPADQKWPHFLLEELKFIKSSGD